MIIHTIVKGDTLYSLSKKYGLPISKIRADNGISEDQYLIVGNDLVIDPLRQYTVKKGDTLYSIARANGVTVNRLFRSNPALMGSPLIFPGQTIYIDDSPQKSIMINGYAYPFISEDVLRRTLPYLSNLTIFSYGFDENGELIEPDDERLIRTAKSYGVAPIMLLTTMTREGNFNNQLLERLFSDDEFSGAVIEEVVETAKEKGFEGVEVDFEFIPRSDGDGYVRFLASLKSALDEAGLPLFVALAPKVSADQRGLLYEGHDYRRIGEIADHVILMTYEWGYRFGPPLAVAPIKNVEEVVRYAVSEIPREKILLGIPNYSYDWPLPYVSGVTEAMGMSNNAAIDIAYEKGAEIMYDEASQTPYFNYYDNNTEHVVWLENARSIDAKLGLVEKYGLEGISIWQIMNFYPQLYSTLGGTFDPE